MTRWTYCGVQVFPWAAALLVNMPDGSTKALVAYETPVRIRRLP